MRTLLVAWLVALAAPGMAVAQGHGGGGAHPPVKMLLVAFAGMEDAARIMAPYRHAVLLKKSPDVADVAIVVYGRAVAGVVPAVKGIPPRAREDQAEALRQGVKIYACENSLEMAGFSTAPLVAGVEKVPLGSLQIAKLVREGYVPIQY